MMIKGFSNGTPLSEMLNVKTAANTVENAAGATEAEAKTFEEVTVEKNTRRKTSTAATSSSMLSGNFFDSNYKRSKYLDAAISSRQQEQNYSAKMNSLVSGLTAQARIWDSKREFGGATPIENTYIIGQKMTTAASTATDQIKTKETISHSEENLDELREGIKERTEQATAEQDETNKGTAETTGTETVGEAASGTETANEPPKGAAETSPASEKISGMADQVATKDVETQHTDPPDNSVAPSKNTKLDITA